MFFKINTWFKNLNDWIALFISASLTLPIIFLTWKTSKTNDPFYFAIGVLYGLTLIFGSFICSETMRHRVRKKI